MEEQLDEAIKLAEKFCGFSSFHPTYPPLFKSLWRERDPEETGAISYEQAISFANAMVAAGWSDWALTEAQQSKLQSLERALGDIPLEHFAEWSENENYHPPKRVGKPGAQMVASHNRRMENFTLPEGPAVAKSGQSEGHCVSCEYQPMGQHPYAGLCRYCSADKDPFSDDAEQILDYQCMCWKCAEKMSRCCGCGNKIE
eukprot:PhF_6_TR15054/c1_g1_i3/m.23638